MELTYGHYSWTLFGVNERRVLLYLYLKIFNFTSDCIFLIEYYFSINENFNFYIFLVCRPVVANCKTRE